ncbi:putative serine esterase-domain-containing protein [Gongronella butleri]|nr:putative serine esterase-domain-containing protein [Gongronella butleri]
MATGHTLIVLQHGLWGNASHMDKMVLYLKKAFEDDHTVHILNSDVNEGKYSYDGVDVCGIRLANKIEEFVEKCAQKDKKVTRLGLVGYSLGGLIARYAAGVLDQKGFFQTVAPEFFVTFATPHLGVRRPGSTFFSKAFNYMSGALVSRSGEQLQLIDKYKGDRPLLSILALPEYPFFIALKKFKILRTYANVSHDRTVPAWTAAMSKLKYFKHLDKLELLTDEKYPSIVTGIKVLKEKKKRKFYPRRLLLYVLFPLLFPIFALIGLTTICVQGLISRRRVARLFSLSRSINEGTGKHHKKHSSSKSALLEGLVLDAVEMPMDLEDPAKGDDDDSTDSDATHTHHTHHTSTWTNVIPSDALLKLAPPMTFDPWTEDIQANISQLPWQIVFVQLDVLNAHGGIISRQRIHTSELTRTTLEHFVDSIEYLHH